MVCNGFTLNGLRVLVVDGRVDDLELFTLVLGQCGAAVTTALSTEEALRAYARVEPDVVVSDLTLPGEDGCALLRTLRERGARVPAIAVTGRAYDRDREAALAAGFQRHLPKPVDPEELVAVIAELSGRVSPSAPRA